MPRLRSLDAPAGVPAVLHHYVIIRRDLPFGVQVAQTIHAAGESSPGNISESTHAVALHAKDEAQLEKIERALLEAGFRFKAIREPDAPYLGALMAIGLSPVVRTPQLRQLLGKLPLIK